MAAGDVTATISRPSGKGCLFDGINDFIKCGNNEILKPTKNLSISLWFKRTENREQGKETLISLGNLTNKHGYTFKIAQWEVGNHRVLFDIGDSVHIMKGATTNTGRVEAINIWYHVIATFAPNEIILYFNGVEDYYHPDVSVNVDHIVYNTKELEIGSHYESDKIKGIIDNVQIFARTLTAREAKNLYHKKQISSHKRIACWSFNNPSDPAHDDSNNGNDGTVTGAISTGGHNTIEDDIKTARVSANDIWGFIPLANNQEIMMVHVEEA